MVRWHFALALKLQKKLELRKETVSLEHFVNLVTPSLLITDDDRDFRETLKEVFAPRGFRTLLAQDGEEALGILNCETVHLLLLDMHMPKLNGLDTIRRVRILFGRLPWILMSARLDDDLRNEAEEEEASGDDDGVEAAN